MVVEDVDSTIILANLVPNKNRSINRTQTLSTAGSHSDQQNDNILFSIGGAGKDVKNTNASIINVDNGDCQVIPSRQNPMSDHVGYHKKVQEIENVAPSSDINICKLFVKEGTPPKLRRKDNLEISNADATTVPFNTRRGDHKTDEGLGPQSLESLSGENNTSNTLNQPYAVLTSNSAINSLSNSNGECHKADYQVEDHHIDVLNGLNRLRNDGSLLDVTLWAENRPFQVGI